MTATSLGHTPDTKWAFDKKVTDCFDDMLERSIPRYRTMRKACLQIGSAFQQDDTTIVDLGCSRGGALADFIGRFDKRNGYVGVDVSEPMLEAATARFNDEPNVFIECCDLRGHYPNVTKASVTLAVLVLQFTPINYRQQILRNIYNSTVSGGCVIVVEKVLGSSALLDDKLVELYHDFKRTSGYSQDEIDRKKLALEGELVPVTARWNEELLAGAGFQDVECFWRLWNFAGWVGVKP